MNIERWITYTQNVLMKHGYVFYRVSSIPRTTPIILNLLKQSRPDIILDVGANIGQYALELIKCGVKLPIISFEPISSAYDSLVSNSKRYKRWTIADRTALGNQDGMLAINISKDTVVSSALKMSDFLAKQDPMFDIDRIESVPVHKLDSISDKYLSDQSRIYLKIDVQGYEKQVLQGSTKTLVQCDAVQVELSFVELYAGQALANEIIDMLLSKGFLLYAFSSGEVRDLTTKGLQQCDAFFIRPDYHRYNAKEIS